MNKYCLILAFVLISQMSFAQGNGYKTINNTSSFQQNLTNFNASIQTTQSDFVQTKHLTLLSDKIVSKGKFYFKKEDKLRMEYASPYYFLMIMNGKQIIIKDEQKTNKINTSSSKGLQSANRIMMDCMKGTIFSNTDFKIIVSENSGNYLMTLTPTNTQLKKMDVKIEVFLNKKMDVNHLVLTESGGDFTTIEFKNIQHNLNLNETLFKSK